MKTTEELYAERKQQAEANLTFWNDQYAQYPDDIATTERNAARSALGSISQRIEEMRGKPVIAGFNVISCEGLPPDRGLIIAPGQPPRLVKF